MNPLPIEIQKQMKVGGFTGLPQLGIVQHAKVEPSFIFRLLKQIETPGISQFPIAYLDYCIPENVWGIILKGFPTNNPKSALFARIEYDGVLILNWCNENNNLVNAYVIFETTNVVSKTGELPTFANICKAVGAPVNKTHILLPNYYSGTLSKILKPNKNSIINPLFFNSLREDSSSIRNDIFPVARKLKELEFIGEVACSMIQ